MVDKSFFMQRRNWLRQICQLNSISSAQKLIAFALAEFHVNAKTKEAYPSHATLADALNLSVRTVRRALDELCDAGFIVKYPPRRGRASNTYKIAFSEDEAASMNMAKQLRQTAKRNAKAKGVFEAKFCEWMERMANVFGGSVTGYGVLQQIGEENLRELYRQVVLKDLDLAGAVELIQANLPD